MKISICTLFEELFEPFFMTSIMKKANLKNLVEFETINIRDYTKDKHTRVDDYPYGGGAGLIMQAQPIIDMLRDIKQENSYVVLLSPAAPVFNQGRAKELAKLEHLILICGHYEGIDERIMKMVDEVLSIGDYVLTGGEIAAMVVVDSVVRLLDGVLAEASTLEESFENHLLEYPQYTRPEDFEGDQVPSVLLSGHHQKIQEWRLKESLRKTYRYRPDLLEKAQLDDQGKALLKQVMAEDDD